MTIRKGEAWEEPAEPGDASAPICADDASLARAAADRMGRGERPVLRVSSGDLLRSLGREHLRAGDEPTLRFSTDLGFVRFDDGEERPFVSSVVARGVAWSGPLAVVMNGGWVGEYYLGPKAHPNDGLLDVTVGSIPASQRREAAKRARTGSHLPHPGLTTRRVADDEIELPRPQRVLVDGVRSGRVRRLSVRVVADAFVLAV